MATTYLLAVLILLIMILIIKNIRIVPQSNAFIIERLGAYIATWQTGIHVKLPFLDKVANKVSLKEKVLDFPPQPVITKDNVTMKIDTVVFCQVIDLVVELILPVKHVNTAGRNRKNDA